MKTNLLPIILFFCFIYSNINAQELKLGKVSVAELDEKTCATDSTAAAAILYNKGRTFFKYDAKEGFSINTEYIFRIKIYKKEGLSWANHKIPYRVGYEKLNDDSVEIINGVTYNLENGTIITTKLKNEGTFKTLINKYWKEATIVMPNVKIGSIIEFKYIIKSEDIVEFPDYNFQYEIPVSYSECITEIPAFFVYKAVTQGGMEINAESKIVNGGLNFNNKDYQTKTESISFNQVNSKYFVRDLKALKKEPFVDNIQNYRVSIFHELEKTQFYQEEVKHYATDWESVTKEIYEDKDFGAELNRTSYFQENVNALIKGLITDGEKITAIFSFIKAKVKWNDHYGYSCNEGVEKAYVNKIGNVAEINLMLTAMLRYAGLNANPVLISTRSNGIALFPSRTGFNYVIAAVEINDGLMLLDATEPYSMPNILPLRDLNWFGRLIRKDGTSKEVNMRSITPSKETTNLNIVLANDGTVDGEIRVQLENHEALYFRQKNVVISENSYLETLENEYNNIEINNYVRENELNLSKPIVENYSFKDSKTVEVISDKIYISPMLFLTPKENPFKQEVREYPIDFGYPWQEKYNVNIKIPDGYVVETLPKPINIATGENVGTFKYIIGNTGNTIQVLLVTNINTVNISPGFYEVIKDFFQQMIDKQNEKIVLKKG